MKTAVFTLSFLLCLTLLPAGAFSAEATGVYVGAKLGASIESFTGREISQDAMEMDFGGQHYSMGDDSWGMGDKTDAAFAAGLVLGYDLKTRLDFPLRLEADYTYRSRASVQGSSDVSFTYTVDGAPLNESGHMTQSNKIDLQTLMVNAWFDIPTGVSFYPYVGGGIGLAFIRHKSTGTLATNEYEAFTNSENETNFAWSLGAGMRWDFAERWAADLGYRYIDAGSSKVTSPEEDILHSKIKVHTHDVMLTLSYTF